jgi:hypothetical protein
VLQQSGDDALGSDDDRHGEQFGELGRNVPSSRRRNQTGTLCGWLDSSTVVSHAIRLLLSLPSTCACRWGLSLVALSRPFVCTMAPS